MFDGSAVAGHGAVLAELLFCIIYIHVYLLCPHHFQCGGWGEHIVSPLSVRTSVPSYPPRPIRPVRNTFGFHAIFFERIGILD